MTDKEILEKTLGKVIDKGYEPDFFVGDDCETIQEYMVVIEEYCFDCFYREILPTIIFDHDFAKAFWGEEKYVDANMVDLTTENNQDEYSNAFEDSISLDGHFEYRTLPTWQYHLQIMVLEKEPLKYLEKFLDKGE